ncbi:sugar phosphate isomerase/epimerase [Candidatus Gracilibacteria bacterium]|nr:sugar phosphate isomerase/epimerase [Candidatus Gracilibacteria bacterium]
MLCLTTGCLYKYGLNRIFEFTKDAGFEGIDVILNDIFDTRDPDYLLRLQEFFKLPIVSLSLPSDASPKRFQAALEIAEAGNIGLLNARAPLFTDIRYSQWFKNEIPKIQKRTKVKIAIENPPATTGFFLPQYSLRNIEDLRRFDYICLDTCHLASQKLPLLRVYKIIRKRLEFVYISNFHNGLSNQPLDEGEIPLESFLTHLRKDNFTKPICIKFNLEAMGAGDKNKVMENLRRAKSFYEEYFLKKQIDDTPSLDDDDAETQKAL